MMAQVVVTRITDMGSSQVFKDLVRLEHWHGLFKGFWELRFVGTPEKIEEGESINVEWLAFGFNHEAVYRVTQWEENRRFSLKQVRGLFKFGELFVDVCQMPGGSTRVRIVFEYEMPFQLLGHLFNDLWLRSQLEHALGKFLESLVVPGGSSAAPVMV